MLFHPNKLELPSEADALPGRSDPVRVPAKHAVLGTPLEGPFEDHQIAIFGMGCFWGAERLFWELEGMVSTAAGYAGGSSPNPTYQEVCSGMTGHAEVVRLVFEPARVSFVELLRLFWENHDPTQGMAQGADVGTQYRSAIYTSSERQQRQAESSRLAYQRAITAGGLGAITTEIAQARTFYFAEAYHQQYLAKNPGGYCGHGGTGIACPAEGFRPR